MPFTASHPFKNTVVVSVFKLLRFYRPIAPPTAEVIRIKSPLQGNSVARFFWNTLHNALDRQRFRDWVTLDVEAAAPLSRRDTLAHTIALRLDRPASRRTSSGSGRWTRRTRRGFSGATDKRPRRPVTSNTLISNSIRLNVAVGPLRSALHHMNWLYAAAIWSSIAAIVVGVSLLFGAWALGSILVGVGAAWAILQVAQRAERSITFDGLSLGDFSMRDGQVFSG